QEVGLVGKLVTKAGRRGGEGLWHPAQRELWLTLVRERSAGKTPRSLAVYPVAIWVFGWPGVELAQVQRARTFWASPTSARRRGTRSTVERNAARLASKYSHPRAARSSRRDLQNWLRVVLDEIDAVRRDPLAPLASGSRDHYVEVFLHALTGGSKPT